METMGAAPRSYDACCEQLGVSCTETLGADPRTYDKGSFGVSCTETMGADTRTDDARCE